eukprot:scaffold824_cov327-Pavlova_lutheri.AAC.13
MYDRALETNGADDLVLQTCLRGVFMRLGSPKMGSVFPLAIALAGWQEIRKCTPDVPIKYPPFDFLQYMPPKANVQDLLVHPKI